VHAQHSARRSAGSRVGTTGRWPHWLTISSVSRTCESRVKNFRKKLGLATPLSRAGTEEAADQFRAAIALDPQFTAAYVSLGMTHYVQAAFTFVPPDSGFPLVRENARKALELNSRSATAHALLARVATLYTMDWLEAERESGDATALGPQNPFALYAAGDLATVLGDFKRSERLLRASLVLDPLNPETHYMLAVVLRAVGRLDEAEAAARRCLSISPTYVFGHYILGNILTMQGREESVAECQLEVPEGGQLTCLAKAYYKLGRAKEADTMLTVAMQLHGLDHAYWIASVFGYIRQEDRAFEWL
jgi:tetratricopeptide (TPR) repeat protein